MAAILFIVFSTPLSGHSCPLVGGVVGLTFSYSLMRYGFVVLFHFFLAVFAEFAKALAVGAPLLPGLRIFSTGLPSAFSLFMRSCFL